MYDITQTGHAVQVPEAQWFDQRRPAVPAKMLMATRATEGLLRAGEFSDGHEGRCCSEALFSLVEVAAAVFLLRGHVISHVVRAQGGALSDLQEELQERLLMCTDLEPSWRHV